MGRSKSHRTWNMGRLDTMSPYFLYRTACQHTIMLKPYQLTNNVPCTVCLIKPVQIIGVQIDEWHVKCKYPRCPFSRWTGISKSLAEQVASEHWRKKHHTIISVKFEENPKAVKELNRLEHSGLLCTVIVTSNLNAAISQLNSDSYTKSVETISNAAGSTEYKKSSNDTIPF